MRRTHAKIWVLTLMIAMSATSWAGLFDVSVDEQKKVGDDAAKEIESKSKIIGRDLQAPKNIQGRSIDEVVSEVGRRLAQASGDTRWNFTFKVIDSPDVNAFALPGGRVYVYTGLIKALKASATNLGSGVNMLAGVIGHEITHVTGEHWAHQYKHDMERSLGFSVILGIVGASDTVQNIAGVVNFTQSQKYSRKDEYRADDGGIKLMAKAGLNPQGVVDMLKMLDKVSGGTSKSMVWLSDHPSTVDRIHRAEKNVAATKQAPVP